MRLTLAVVVLLCSAGAWCTSAAQAPAVSWMAGARPLPAAFRMIDLLRTAAADGLDPADYGVGRLDSVARAMAAGSSLPAGAAQLDSALTSAATRFLTDLRSGRVPSPLRPLSARFDVRAALGDAIRGDSVAALVAAQRPPFTQYRALAAALARYRQLPRLAASLPDALPDALPIRVGARLVAASRVRRLLEAVGDLDAGMAGVPPAADTIYDAALADGVRRFQERHGLEPDGVIGPATAAALATPIPRRIRQLELAMERLRWLPRIGAERFLVVNVPAFALVAFDSAAGPGVPALQMRVIVGDAVNRQTPMLSEQLRSVQFRPYWNVPPSILRREILPKLRRSPGYLRANAMEIVGAGGTVLGDVPTPALLGALARGAARVRQRPGPDNSLGLVKLVFPNPANVYLHGTPALSLFLKPRRDFSHGCIRVEDPAALVTWVLQDEPGWSRERVDAAIAGPASSEVRLAHPMPVLVFYTTAVVRAGGPVYFYPDIYGQDRLLDAALAARPRPRG